MDEQTRHNIEVSQSNLDMHQETKNISYRAVNYILFAVGAGTFVLSVNFLGGTDGTLSNPWFLISAWIFLGLSIVGQVASHFFVIQQADAQVRLNNRWRREEFVEQIDDMERKDENIRWLVRWGNFVLYVTVAFLLMGIIQLIAFVSLNVLVQNKVEEMYGVVPCHHDRSNWGKGREAL